MQIEVLASSSSGNCYHVSDGQTEFLIECGLPVGQIRDGLRRFGGSLSTLSGCLVSHEHGDHARAVRVLQEAAVDIYATSGTWDTLSQRENGITSHRARSIKHGQAFTLGSFRVLPFETIHDAEEPLGFLIASGSERLLYATDTAYLKYRFAGLTHLMIEANYSAEILAANVQAGRVAPELKRRIVRSHFSLENVIDALKANDLSRVKEIWLLHLSDGNSDEQMFKAAVERATGCVCHVAIKGGVH